MALSQTSVLKLYNTVIEDVINGVRDSFIDEGVDEQVLQELKQIWENKLMASKAVELNPDLPEPQPPQVATTKNTNKGGSKRNASAASNAASAQQNQHQQHEQQNRQQKSQIPVSFPQQHQMTQQQINSQQLLAQQQHFQHQIQHRMHQQVLTQQLQQQHHHLMQQQAIHRQVAQQNLMPPGQQSAAMNSAMPVNIQIKLPPHQSLPERFINLVVPASAIQTNQLHAIFSGPVISAAIGVPTPYATSLLQQHINATFEGYSGFTPVPVHNPVLLSNNSVPPQHMVPPPGQHQGNIAQVDGAHGLSSDEDEDEEEEENNDEEVEKEDEENDEASAREEEPLNSEDDVSDDDPTDLFDTDNVVVCQYDKITRSRNKWKFYLKDGIMNLNGKDFVFQKANGEAEW